MRRRLRDRSRATVVVLAVLTAGAACVRQGDPKVAVDKVQASLVFGAKPAEERPAGLQTAPEATPEEVAEAEIDTPDVLVNFKKAPLKLAPRTSSCPEAGDSDSAERALGDRATAPPANGVYRYRKSGFIANGASNLPVSGAEHRAIAHATKVDDNTYTYDYYLPAASGNLLVQHIQMKNNGVQANPSAGVGVVGTPRYGEPERGVVLKGLEERDPATGNTAAPPFQPASGLLLLPLPVAAGEEFESVAVDRTRGRTIVLQGTVRGPLRVDACGKYVDGWQVEASVRDSGSGSESAEYTWRYAIAPQYGGLLINESLIFGDSAGPDAVFTFKVGQLDPDPLPAGF